MTHMITTSPPRPMVRSLAGTALVALQALAAACGGGGTTAPPPPNTTSTFTATVTGDIKTTLQGTAVFGGQTSGGTQLFSIGLTGSGSSGGLTFMRQGGGPPGTGSYTIADMGPSAPTPPPGQFTGMFVTYVGATPLAYVSRSGAVTITSVTGNRLQGTFTLHAGTKFVNGQSTTNVNIIGQFDAVGGTVPAP